jgi:hypothetical protein
MRGMNTNVPFINLEYIFVRIYDFFVYIKNIFTTGSIQTVSGGTSDFASNFGTAFSWILTILTLALVGFIVWAIYIRIRVYEVDEILGKAYTDHFIKPEIKQQKTNQKWELIKAHFESTNPNDWRAAIIDADTLLEDLVTSLGYTGESLGAQLTSIKVNDFPTIQSAWEGHKMRNIIAHEGSSFNLTERQKEITRRHFEAVFRDAGII